MKFTVENLAKIEKAEIETKDLTIFVGKNSTNKSYMAHVVYELNKTFYTENELKNPFKKRKNTLLSDFLKQYDRESLFSYLDDLKIDEKREMVEHQIGPDEFDYDEVIELIYEIDFDNHMTNKILNDIYSFLNNYLLNTINKTFNTNSITLEKITFDINIKQLFQKKQISTYAEFESFNHQTILNTIFNTIKNHLMSNFINAKQHFYFPASRTGFVLAFDEIVSGVLRSRFGGQPTATKLPEPTIDFISNFADIKSGSFQDRFYRKPPSIEKIISHLESNIIKGKIIEEQQDLDYLHYKLQINEKTIDLHLSSSATIELLPFIIFLKQFSALEDKLLVIEEPEAHLHPKAQIEMARFLIMLVNAGAKVLVTTHSDYILNEINNCIKLSSLDEESENDIAISKDRVSSYLFKDEGEKNTVHKLEIDEYGISNENFDDVLDELLDRSEKLNFEIEK